MKRSREEGEAQRGPDSSPIRLLSAWYCPFAQRAWIALEEAGVEYELVEAMTISEDQVNYDKSKELLAANPNGMVPVVMRFDKSGKRVGCVYESGICVEYVDEALRPEFGKGGRLFPDDGEMRAHCRIWIDFVGKKLVPQFYKMLVKTDPAEREEAKVALRAAMAKFAESMAPAEEGPFFLGKEFSAVDIAFVPWAYRMFVLQHYRQFDWHSGDAPEPAMERFDAWMAAALSRASVKATLAHKDALIATYKRYADNVTTSQVAESVRKGTAIP
jgi:glutathione S-transferase